MLTILAKSRPFESERPLIWRLCTPMNAMRISALLGMFAILLLPAVSCGGCPATPSVSSISPNTAASGGDGLVLTVSGGNFSSNAVVVWDGTPLTTSFVNSNQLTATISSAQLATPDTAVVYVYNPLPGTQTVNSTSIVATSSNGCGAKGSNAVSFTVSP